MDGGAAGRRRSASLLVALALATPVGLVIYSQVGTGIFAPRNLTASIPAACLVAGWLLARLPARAALAAGGLVAAGLLVGLVISLGPSKQRPDFAAAASFVDAHARARATPTSRRSCTSPTRRSCTRA